MNIRHYLLLAVLTCLVIMQAAVASAQLNVFYVRIDTLTAKPGDTVVLNVLYTFTAPKTHNIRCYAARFTFDSTLVRVVDFITDGTASSFATIEKSRKPPEAGIVAFGDQEIDLTNPILFRIRIAVNSKLSDSARLLWDRSATLIDPLWGVDSVVETDGWIKSPTVNGHVVLSTPASNLHGKSDGFTADTVQLQIPVSVSNIAAANITSAVLRFDFDSTRLRFLSASSGLKTVVTQVTRMSNAVSVQLSGSSVDPVIVGVDTLIYLNFIALIGTDTVCTSLMGTRLIATNGGAFIGNTDYDAMPICLLGEWKGTNSVAVEQSTMRFRMFPNPARDRVRFHLEGSKSDDRCAIVVYDLRGNAVFRSNKNLAVWDIRPETARGVYEVVFEDVTLGVRNVQPVIVGP